MRKGASPLWKNDTQHYALNDILLFSFVPLIRPPNALSCFRHQSMLPTHAGQVDGASNQTAIIDPSTMHAYPPSGGRNGSRNGQNSLQTRLFGPRGIAAFTVQTKTPLERESESPVELVHAVNNIQKYNVKPPRWRTLEFKFYALVFLTIVPLMCWIPIRLSLESAKNFPIYSSHLQRGWLFGRLRDDSDFQYKSFRDYVLILFIVMIAYLALSKFSERAGTAEAYRSLTDRIIRPNRIPFLVVFTSVFLVTLHGLNVIKLLSACAINYLLARLLGGTHLATPLIWAWNVGILYAVHYYEGFSFASINNSLSWMDDYTGLLPRWQINFNITMLRLVSFGLDYHWARKAAAAGTQAGSANTTSKPILDARKRGEAPLALQDYSILNYLLYALYPPLFIAGPIMTFNDFCRQTYNPLNVSQRYTLMYAVRWIFSLLSMEFILHFMYVNAIKDSKAWRGATPLELSMIGFWNLIVVWLKLLIPWRFFRLWALADGIDAPENMIRCMANNYSTLGFWRSWHRSYNLWIVRYIYVPVGGAKNVVPATLLVFTFVALWHDLSLKLLTWGWLVTLFILPEIICRQFFTEKQYGDLWWFRHLCAAGGVVNVLMMMTANLVGFAIGTDGMAYMWQQLLADWDGILFMFSACAVLFVGVQVMFEYREEELRRGIDRKC